MSETQTVIGGWTAYRDMEAADQAVFEQAMSGFIGVVYTALSVSTQAVDGTNYRFKAAASMPPEGMIWESIIEIFQPLQGRPVVISIYRI